MPLRKGNLLKKPHRSATKRGGFVHEALRDGHMRLFKQIANKKIPQNTKEKTTFSLVYAGHFTGR